MLDTALLLAAAFFAGTLNAVAGGGSFLTLPALIAVGVPSVTANATGTGALLPCPTRTRGGGKGARTSSRRARRSGAAYRAAAGQPTGR